MGSEWQSSKLRDVIAVNPPRLLYKSSESVYISMQQIESGNRSVSEIAHRGFKGSGARFKNGDTLLARITPCLENGKTAYVDFLEAEEVAHGSTEFIVLSGIDGISDNLFVYYLSRYPEFRQFAINRMEGSSGRQRVPAMVLENYIFDFPPFNEQRAIAHILGSLDDKIELNRRMNQTLEAIARAIFKSWFIDFDPVIDNALRAGNPIPDSMAERTEIRRQILDQNQPTSSNHRAKGRDYQGGFDSSGLGEVSIDEIYGLFPDSFQDSELGAIPKGWEVKSLDQIANYLNGIACQKFPPEGGKPSLPVIKIRELRQGISENTDRASSDVPDEYIVDDGDVLFSWSGSLIIDIWTQGKGVLNQHLYKVTSENYPKWFYYYWTDYHLIEFQRIAAYKATTMGHIKRHHLTDAHCYIVGEDIMRIANDQIAPLLTLRINNELETRKLASLRETLLPKLISGELRIPDVEKLLV